MEPKKSVRYLGAYQIAYSVDADGAMVDWVPASSAHNPHDFPRHATWTVAGYVDDDSGEEVRS